jgi:hypothetical protein
MLSSILRIGFGGLIAAVCLLGASGARAEITEIIFCNKFGHDVWIAIAYPQTGGSFISRGWMSLSDGQCVPFDTALRVTTFYFRGESVRYRDTDGRNKRFFWGKGEKFAIWEDSNFQYYDAQKRVLKSTLAEFTQGPVASGGDVSSTVTFTPDGSQTTTTIPGTH